MEIPKNSLMNCFIDEIILKNGVYYPLLEDSDKRADITWSKAAKENPINAAAATSSQDYFTKFPEWIEQYIDEGVENILDAGCGYGRIAIPLLKKYPNLNLLGVDASPIMLEKFLHLAKDNNVINRVVLYKGNLSTLPIRDNYFDSIISSAVLLHNPYWETEAIVTEMYRVLKPGGRIIMSGSFPNLYNLEGLQNFVYEKFKSHLNGPVRVYTKKQVKNLFHKFQNVNISSTSLVVLPRQVVKLKMPFGSLIRKVNTIMSGKYLDSCIESEIFTSCHEVVAQK